MKTYWYSDRIGDELYVDYNVESVGNPFIYTKNHHYIRSCDSVITELPESFCVKRCDDNKKWYKYLEWLVKQKNYSNSMFGRVFVGVLDGVIGKKLHYDDLYPFGIEIHIDDMIKHIDYMESQQHIKGGEQFHKESQLTVKMNTQKLSRQGLKEIHSVACSTWKILLEQYGSRNPLEDYIELSQEEVNNMFNACTKEQLPIVSKYLKQDDGSVYLTNIKTDSDSNSIWLGDNCLIAPRTYDEYGGKAFCLNDAYKWEIKTDDYNQLCLIPTKKK